MSRFPGYPPVPEYGIAPPRRRFIGGRLFAWVLFIALAVVLFMLLQKGSTQYASIPLSVFQEKLKEDKVRSLTIEGSRICGDFVLAQTLPPGVAVLKFQTQVPPEAVSWQFTQWILDHRGNATVTVENNQHLLVNIIVPLIPWLLIFGFLWFFFFRHFGKPQQPQQQIPYANYPPAPTTTAPPPPTP